MVSSSPYFADVSRTSSASSIDFTANAFNPTEARRTRKRISAVQLAHLEDLYRHSSHPTRDERDALAKRIQMETKSVTIWFQNKRQTDRKVALHNATNSRNEALSNTAPAPPPNITLTAPTSPAPAHPPHTHEPAPPRRVSSEGIPRRPSSTRPMPLKRTSSLSSSITSTSTTSTNSSSKKRLSLDRVASRTEIRFITRHPATRSAPLTRASSVGSVVHTPSAGTPPLSRTSSTTTQEPPASPPPAGCPALWETMLSSPAAPSSPPPPDYIAYARTRKARTLDWACAARLAAPEPSFPSWPESAASAPRLGPSFSASKSHDAAARAREYEEATSVTEDEAELVTPHSSQDASMPWPAFANKMDVVDEGMDDDLMSTAPRGWEEHEMHAALALCGLRG